MVVGLDPDDRLVIAYLAAPRLRRAGEQALVASESVDQWAILAAERELVRFVGDRQTGAVCDVLAKRELAVDVKSGHRLVDTVVRDQSLGLHLELVVALLGETIAQHPVGIVLAAMIIDAKRDFINDHRPDAAEIDCI